ncbi:protein of uncharacterised function (DUF1994) [Mycobacteroides abscessus subsp. massiliense]|uniref:HNH endonuclease family protein n=2 Tax=Mycobacteroides abscessus TaxID=36809 RepID=UPI0009D4632F|nr:protein of uncharacterised function (DUF1994) [Mycobacteroides abscessus subsp. massiliense]SKU13124.1 protein of uncharacterised function (DUF1994) [Mycobacteroides abscessus subsp. massiliense]
MRLPQLRSAPALLIVLIAAGALLWLGVSPMVKAPGEPVPAPDPIGNQAQTVTDQLRRLVVVNELPDVPGYDRSCKKGDGCTFGPAWTDVRRTGCDTRSQLLRKALRDVVFKPRTRNCKVLSGTLWDPYSAAVIQYSSADPATVNADHIFPLARGYRAGAAGWPYERRVEFANDLDTNLIAVSAKENLAKSDAGIGEWLPPAGARLARCQYVQMYLAVAIKYQLLITVRDRSAAEQACGLM